MRRLIYFTLITQKVYRNYRLVLEGADVGIVGGGGNQSTRRKQPTLDRRPLFCLNADAGDRTQVAVVTSEGFIPGLSRPQAYLHRQCFMNIGERPFDYMGEGTGRFIWAWNFFFFATIFFFHKAILSFYSPLSQRVL